VPSDDRIRLDDDSSIQQRRHKAIEPDEEQSVPWREPWPGGLSAPQQVQLMAQEDNLGLKPGLRLERRSQYMQQQAEERNHPPRLPDLPVHYRVDRVFGRDTDNGSCYRSGKFAKACRRLRLKHIRTKPYTPRTNGKAERFFQTSLREWAYARAYLNSKQRAQELPFFLHRYNWHRPHASIGGKPPITRLGLTEDNLLRLHSWSGPTECRKHLASPRGR
jgi:hypothetical protein